MSAFFGDLNALRQRPIPDLGEAMRKRRGYRDHPIDRAHALADEPLVSIADHGIDGLNFYHRADNPPYYVRAPGSIPDLLLRSSVVRRLKSVDDRLRPRGLRLHVFDAFRPTAVQAFFFHTWTPERIRARDPHLSPEEVAERAERYWAEPTVSPERPAPHSTGSAVDLTIRNAATGEHLWMGSIFDDATAIAHTDHFETARAGPDASYSDEEARANRRLLYWLMEAAGFANNPNEWWHFSWGDQMWAALSGEAAAIYGSAEAR